MLSRTSQLGGVGVRPLFSEKIERLGPLWILQCHCGLRPRERQEHKLKGHESILRPLEGLGFSGILVRIGWHALLRASVERQRRIGEGGVQPLIKRMGSVDGQNDFSVPLIDVIEGQYTSCL